MTVGQALLFFGLIFGLIFGLRATLEWGWKEGLVWFFGCLIGTPLVGITMFVLFYIIKELPI